MNLELTQAHYNAHLSSPIQTLRTISVPGMEHFVLAVCVLMSLVRQDVLTLMVTTNREWDNENNINR